MKTKSKHPFLQNTPEELKAAEEKLLRDYKFELSIQEVRERMKISKTVIKPKSNEVE